VVGRYDGRLPEDAKTLRSLPGVGAYTAAAVECFAFGRQVGVVDTNVSRVLGRFEGRTPTPREIATLAAAYLPVDRAAEWNQALMDLGASICRAASTVCAECPVRAACLSSGGVVREMAGKYRVEKSERFEDSNRHLRGRIVDALRGAVDGLTIGDLAAQLALEGVDGRERLDGPLAGLELDGLLTVDPASRRVRLPD
jgi:A/G-specific adenine glycosylase